MINNANGDNNKVIYNNKDSDNDNDDENNAQNKDNKKYLKKTIESM